jgi:predicted acetyltransferase
VSPTARLVAPHVRYHERLRRAGGHIGYWIRPSARRRGHATAAFREGLAYAHRLGIDPALVTCDEDNIGSRRIIERAGGIFDRQIGVKRLYWVLPKPDSGL